MAEKRGGKLSGADTGFKLEEVSSSNPAHTRVLRRLPPSARPLQWNVSYENTCNPT